MTDSFVLEVTYGYVRTDAWFERVGGALVGMGSCTYSDGRKVTAPTGIVVTGDSKTLDMLPRGSKPAA